MQGQGSLRHPDLVQGGGVGTAGPVGAGPAGGVARAGSARIETEGVEF